MTKTNQKIPEGWSVKKLGEISSFKSGGTPNKNKSEYWNGNIPWISASSMRGFIYRDSNEKISEIGLKNGSNYVNKGDLLILVRGSMLWNCIPVGIAANLLAFNQDVKGISVKSDVEPYFVLYWFYTNEQKIKNMVVGTGIGAGKLETDELKNLDILLPPLPEQEKIAEILGTWDTAIEKLSALIEQKKQLKKGLMQRLLTGKQRLPGFSAPWKKVKLGDFLEIKHGKNQKAIECQNGIFPILATGGEIGRTNTFLYDKPSVLIGRKGTINKPQYIETPFWTVDTLFWSKMKKANIAKFFYYLFQMIKWEVWDEGSTIPSLNASTIMSIKIKISDNISEQKAIADILSKADEEITLLTEKLSALKTQKTGLMQKLLTGQIRVKVA